MPQSRSSAIDQLLAAFGNEADAYRRMVALTMRERQALQRGDLAEVASIVQEKSALMQALVQDERTRMQMVAGLAEAFGLASDSRLQQIMLHLDDVDAAELRVVRQECIGMVEDLRLLNRGNRGLIQTRLDRIEATLGFLSRTAVEDDGHYSARGDSHALVHTGHVLNWQA